MATEQEITDFLTIVKAKLLEQGFVFGTSEPDFLEKFSTALSELILDFGGSGSGAEPGNVNWDLVEIEDLMAILIAQIKTEHLFEDLKTPIESIPDIKNLIDNVVSNLSPVWSPTEIYRVGQVVSYEGLLYESTSSILSTPNSSPNIDTSNWKVVGTFNSVYNVVGNIVSQIVNIQQIAEGAVSDISTLSTEILGPEGDATASGYLYDETALRVSADEANAEDINALSVSMLGPEGDASSSGYMYNETTLRAQETSAMAEDIEQLGVTVGDNSADIATEKSIRAVISGPDYRTDVIYGTKAIVVYGDQLWQNNSGNEVGPEEFNPANWTPINQSLYAQYSIKLDVNGYVSGFGMSNDGATSNFIVNADTFAIDHPSNTQGSVIPFIIQDGKVWMDTAYVKDLSAENFVGNKIIANEISVGAQITDSVDYTSLSDMIDTIDATYENMLVLATSTGEIVNELPGLESGINNFNARNDRISVTPIGPTILTDGTAIDFTFNSDGSSNIDFAWGYGSGTDETNIDGFLVYIKSSDTNTVYDLNVNLTGSQYYQVPLDKREIRFMSLAPDKYYTVGIEAFRVVDNDINSSGILRSSISQPTILTENPIYLTLTVPVPTLVTLTEL